MIHRSSLGGVELASQGSGGACGKAELIWRISRKISTLVLGMMTQGTCVQFLACIVPGPAVQLYLMDLCTYDSLMIVKVANLSLYHNNQADLASFLDVAVHMLAARVWDASLNSLSYEAAGVC